MPLTPCKSCKKEVAHNAKTCPHCGVSNPGVTARQTLFGFLGLAAIVGVLVVSCGDSEEEKQAAKQAAETADAACMQDLQCIGNKGTITAGVYCPEHIEKLAKNSAKWTDGALEPKFSRFRWKDKEAGIVTHLGDKVQFQNGFGAYINMIYSCDLDMKQGQGVVVGVDAAEGRL